MSDDMTKRLMTGVKFGRIPGRAENDEINRIRDTFAACFDDVDQVLATKIIAALSALLRDAIFNNYGDSKPLDVWDELARFHRIVLAEMIAARWKEEEASRPLEKDRKSTRLNSSHT